MRLYLLKYKNTVALLAVFFFVLQTEKAVAQSYPPHAIVYGVDPFTPRLYGYDTSVVSWNKVINQPLSISGFTISELGGLAFDPCTFETYATAILTGSTISNLIKIDLATGACTNVGNLGDVFASIQFDKFGQLYGVTDDAAALPERFYSIDKTNASKTLLVALGNGVTVYGETILNFSNTTVGSPEK